MNKLFKWLLFIVCMALLASGCSSSKKLKQSTYSKLDSIGKTVSTKSGTSSMDSSVSKKTESKNTTSIKVNFSKEKGITANTGGVVTSDNFKEKFPNGLPNYRNAKKEAEDLAGPQKTYSVNIAGKKIESNIPIESVDITTEGVTTQIDVTAIIKKDSGQSHSEQTATVSKENKAKNKQGERTGPTVLLWLGLAVTTALMGVWWWYGFFPFNRLKSKATKQPD